MKMSLVVAVACAVALGTTALLPADLSPIGSAYAKGDGGGHGGGNGGGNGGGHGGGKGDAGGNHGSNSNGANDGGEHAGKATRDHGLSGNHYGSEKNDSKGHGQATSAVAHSRDTQGKTKAAAISATKPAHKNTQHDN
ncbi:hypothetical protein FEA48_12945 [Pseudomonas nitroreducens]|uniref:Glycine-rich protein n=1 Tax=Pseudomonas nitroreducens TaxID=46680 RepID=A0A5R9AAH5_PSENT|nr:hypothetical protein [Pseudomonas nitroreducens]TLP75104.1 hypothetical protein FEA48_12945 [Pseudomonas nitroreducens]